MLLTVVLPTPKVKTTTSAPDFANRILNRGNTRNLNWRSQVADINFPLKPGLKNIAKNYKLKFTRLKKSLHTCKFTLLQNVPRR